MAAYLNISIVGSLVEELMYLLLCNIFWFKCYRTSEYVLLIYLSLLIIRLSNLSNSEWRATTLCIYLLVLGYISYNLAVSSYSKVPFCPINSSNMMEDNFCNPIVVKSRSSNARCRRCHYSSVKGCRRPCYIHKLIYSEYPVFLCISWQCKPL